MLTKDPEHMICKKAREIFVAKWRDKIACDSARRSSFLIGIRYVIIGDYSQREPHPRLTPALQTQYEAERREMARKRFEKAPSGTLGSCRVNSSETNSKYRKHYITSFRGAVLPVELDRHGLVMYNDLTTILYRIVDKRISNHKISFMVFPAVVRPAWVENEQSC
jgi:hypothetical protein